jgi:hypothetical protein
VKPIPSARSLGGEVGTSPSYCPADCDSDVTAIQHLVLFRFPRELTDEEEAEMFAQVRTWPRAIGSFDRLSFGRTVEARSRGYEYALVVEFPDQEAADRYYPHPVHQAFAGFLAELDYEALVFDYTLEPPSVFYAR